MAPSSTRLIYFTELNAVDKASYNVSVDPYLNDKNRQTVDVALLFPSSRRFPPL